MFTLVDFQIYYPCHLSAPVRGFDFFSHPTRQFPNLMQ
jgi:hypothetical protein